MLRSTNWVLLFLIVVTGWSFGQPVRPGKANESTDKAGESAKPGEPANKSLESLMAQALHNNPDVLSAESKVREAELELKRAKLVLALKVAQQKIAVDNQRQIAASAQDEFEMYQALVKRGAGSESDKRLAEQKMLLAKAQLAQAEATLNTTAGVLPKSVAAMVGSHGPVVAPGALPVTGANIGGPLQGRVGNVGLQGSGVGNGFGGIGGGMSITGGVGGIAGIPNAGCNGMCGALGVYGGGGFPDAAPVRAPSAAMADKLRAVLSATIKVSAIKDKPLADVITSLRPSAGGVPFLLQLGDKAKVPVSMSLDGELQLGAVFQALEDVVPGLKCYVREYGILVTMDDSPVEGAMPLVDFWQRKPVGK